MRVVAMLCLLALAGFVAAGDGVTDIVATQRQATELLPVLQPLAGDDVSVQVFNGQLVLHGPADRVAALRAVIERLDRPLQNLRVSVRRHAASTGNDRVARDVLRDGRVVFERGSVATRQGGDDVQQLVLVEGSAARLSLDTEIPVLGIAPSGAAMTSFVPLGNGIELKPTIAGDRIRLEISRRDARLADQGIAAQAVQAVLLLAPGEWTDLGVVAGTWRNDTATGQGGTSYVDRQQRDSGSRDETRWDVRVDLLDP